MTGAQAEIVPRNLRFDLRTNAQRHWFAGDPFKTALMDAFAIPLPGGERFFIKALKHYESRTADPQLKAEIAGYAAQEAFHTREHVDYNAGLKSLNYDVDAIAENCQRPLDEIVDPLERLTITCAIEHLTTTFSVAILANPHILDGAAPAYRRLWVWHVTEELEHQAVALNVFAMACAHMSPWKRYWLRIRSMNKAMRELARLQIENMPIYLSNDGMTPGPRFWYLSLKAALVDPGIVRLGLATFLSYYLPGYDPGRRRTDHLVKRGLEWLDREISRTADQPDRAQ